MRSRRPAAFAAAALLAAAAPLFAAPAGWHTQRDDGLAAARRSGKPVLVVTCWAPKV